jgi:hypothetical protein
MNDADIEVRLRSVTVHEAAHFVVATEGFGIPATMKVDVAEDDTLAGGWCFREFPGDSFAASCVGWAGLVGEHLVGAVFPARTPLLFPLGDKTAGRWHHEALFFLDELSEADRQGIVGYRHTEESLRFTVRLLSRNRAELEENAALLAERTRKEIEARWNGIRRPPETSPPWHLGQFVAAMDPDAETFRAFVSTRVEQSPEWLIVQRYIAEHRLPDGAPLPSLEAWTATRLADYESRGIPDRQSWRTLGRAFLTWRQQYHA